MNLDPNFKEFVRLLNKHGVEYLIVGGYAVVLHGYVRATGDIDIWVRSSGQNAERVLRSIEEFGFGSLGLKAGDFEKEGTIIQLGRPPLRIDLITNPDGLKFDTCYSRRVVAEVEKGLSADFIDLESLKANKRTVGRPKDLDDLENLSGE